MRIQDMVLVIENTKGSETNMLMTVKEYKEAYRDICFPVTAEFRGKLNTLMTDAYEKAAAEVQEQIRGGRRKAFCQGRTSRIWICRPGNKVQSFSRLRNTSSGKTTAAPKEKSF